MTTTLPQSIANVALGTGLLLLIPLVAMQFTKEVNWTGSDFVFAGVVLFSAGLAFVLLARLGNSAPYKLGVGVGVGAGLLLVWANAAVGLVGSEHNPANLLYGAVLAVAFIGALVARFQPLGTSWAMFAAALTYVAVTLIAMFVWTPSGGAAEPSVHFANVLGANMAFAFMWVVAGVLFRRAASSGQ